MTAMNVLAANDIAPVQPGRRPTITDVARLAGVSKKTVSRVINDEAPVKPETRERVQAVIAETGYVPDPQARALAFGRPCLVGLIYETLMAPSMMVMPLGMLAQLRGTGVEMVIHPSDMTSPDFLNELRGFVRRQRLLGVILTPPISDDIATLNLLDEMECPYVRIAAGGASEGSRVIDTQDECGGRLAAEHLLDLGHHHFAYVAGVYSGTSQARLRGFRAGLAERGIDLAADRMIEAGFGYEKGIAAGVTLMGLSQRPTAVFAETDELAAGVLRTALDLGVRAPEDLSIVGYGDFRVAPVASLTTIRTTTWDVGALAVRRLLNGPDTGAELPRPSLIVRASTAPAPV
jgi:LacI family transcriptional regulator